MSSHEARCDGPKSYNSRNTNLSSHFFLPKRVSDFQINFAINFITSSERYLTAVLWSFTHQASFTRPIAGLSILGSSAAL